MTVHFKRSVGVAALLISTSQFAYAEVTAQDVWADWKGYMTNVGYDVTGTESQSGDTLTVRDMSMSIALPDDEGTVAFTMNSLVFTGNGDGTVTVTMPSTMPLVISGEDDGEKFDATINYDQSGHSMVVSGDPDNLNYQYSAAQIRLSLASLLVDGQPVPDDLARASLTMTNVASTSQMKNGAIREYSQRLSMDSLSYDAAFDDPESDDGGVFSGSLVGLSFKGSGTVPPDMAKNDFQAMLDAGFAFDGAFDYTSGNSSVDASGDGDTFALKSSSQGGRLGVAMNAARIAYDVSQVGTSLDVTTSQLPFPITANMSEAAFKIDMPIAQSDEEQGFAFSIRLGDFTTSDMIWGLIDPGAVLPRDPATVILDLSGKVKILAKFLSPEVAANLDGPPGEINALSINQLLVSAVGAKLTGSGEFTFDNSDLVTFGGMPAPAGVANLELVGANGVMDKLIQMGLMAESDAMPARMMMGLLAVPGAGEDSLVSKIEIGEDGSITANGQRIK